MAITSQPFVRFTSFNFWLVGLRALYQLGHLPTTGSAMAPLAGPLDPRLGPIYKALRDCLVPNPIPISNLAEINPQGSQIQDTDNLNLPSSVKLTPSGIATPQKPPTQPCENKQKFAQGCNHPDSNSGSQLMGDKQKPVDRFATITDSPSSSLATPHKIKADAHSNTVSPVAKGPNVGTIQTNVQAPCSASFQTFSKSSGQTSTSANAQPPIHVGSASPVVDWINAGATQAQVGTPPTQSTHALTKNSAETPLSTDVKEKFDRIKMLKEKLMLKNSPVGHSTKRKPSSPLVKSPAKFAKIETPLGALKRNRDSNEPDQGNARKKLKLEA